MLPGFKNLSFHCTGAVRDVRFEQVLQGSETTLFGTDAPGPQDMLNREDNSHMGYVITSEKNKLLCNEIFQKNVRIEEIYILNDVSWNIGLLRGGLTISVSRTFLV